MHKIWQNERNKKFIQNIQAEVHTTTSVKHCVKISAKSVQRLPRNLGPHFTHIIGDVRAPNYGHNLYVGLKICLPLTFFMTTPSVKKL